MGDTPHPRPDQAMILDPDSELLKKVRESVTERVHPYKLDRSAEPPQKPHEESLVEKKAREEREEEMRLGDTCREIKECLEKEDIASAGIYLKGFLLQYDFDDVPAAEEKLKSLTNLDEVHQLEAAGPNDVPSRPKKYFVDAPIRIAGQDRSVRVTFYVSPAKFNPTIGVDRVTVR